MGLVIKHTIQDGFFFADNKFKGQVEKASVGIKGSNKQHHRCGQRRKSCLSKHRYNQELTQKNLDILKKLGYHVR